MLLHVLRLVLNGLKLSERVLNGFEWSEIGLKFVLNGLKWSSIGLISSEMVLNGSEMVLNGLE